MHFADVSKLLALLEAIRAHPEINVWSANVINNDVCQHFQTQDGLGDDSGMSWGYPHGGGWGEVSRNAKNALKVHKYFLANADRFRSMEGIRSFGERISINFIGYSGRTAKIVSTIMKQSREVNSGDDEGGITHIGNHDYGLVQAVFLPFIVAHGSFGAEETSNIFVDVAAMYQEANLSF